MSRYTSNKPCVKCGGMERYVIGRACVVCKLAQSKANQQSNATRTSAYNSKAYAKKKRKAAINDIAVALAESVALDNPVANNEREKRRVQLEKEAANDSNDQSEAS